MFPVDRPTRLTFPTFDEYRMWEPMPTSQAPVQSPVEDTVSLLQRVREPLRLVMPAGGGPVGLAATGSSLAGRQLVGTLPPLFPEWLGERSFAAAHGVRFPYVAGEMANGIATTGMVTAMAGAGMLGFFGAGGLGYREVETDSGGHTDNRPLGSLFPVIAALAEKMRVRHGYDRPLRIGAAGGLGTPGGVAAAFALGAAYVVTGSVNQVAAEAGLSADAKALLGEADLADVVMAPAADMFE